MKVVGSSANPIIIPASITKIKMFEIELSATLSMV